MDNQRSKTANYFLLTWGLSSYPRTAQKANLHNPVSSLQHVSSVIPLAMIVALWKLMQHDQEKETLSGTLGEMHLSW